MKYLLTISVIFLFGCAVTAYHHDHFADGNKVESVELWQGQLLFPSEYKNGSFNLADGTSASIGQSKRWPDPNSIEAAGMVIGSIINEIAKGTNL